MLLAYAAISFTARPAFTSAIDLEAKYRSLLAAHDETVHAVALLKREAELPAAKVDASLTSLQSKLQEMSASVEAAEQARAALVRAQEGMAERVNRLEAASTSVGQAMEEKAAQLRARTESHLTEIEAALAHLKTDFAAIEGKDIVAHIARLRASLVEEAVTAVLDAVSSERLALHASVNDTASALMSSVRKELMAEVKKETATVIGRHVGEQVGKAVLDQKGATSLLNWFDSSKGKLDHAAMEMAVKSVLAKLYTDRLGKVDWLLGINGARILSSSDTNCNSGSMLDSAFCRLVPSLSAVQLNSESFLSGDVQTDTSWLETSAAVLGNCWAMKGAQGHVTVALVQPIKPSQFVVQHAPVSITVDAGKSAPRSFRIQGRLPPDAAAPAGTQRSWVDLVEGQYHLMSFNAHTSNLTPHMQTFDSLSGSAVDAVRFEVRHQPVALPVTPHSLGLWAQHLHTILSLPYKCACVLSWFKERC